MAARRTGSGATVSSRSRQTQCCNASKHPVLQLLIQVIGICSAACTILSERAVDSRQSMSCCHVQCSAPQHTVRQKAVAREGAHQTTLWLHTGVAPTLRTQGSHSKARRLSGMPAAVMWYTWQEEGEQHSWMVAAGRGATPGIRAVRGMKQGEEGEVWL